MTATDAEQLGEAIDTLITLGWAALAWITALAAVATVTLLGTVAASAWAVRAVWRAIRRPHAQDVRGAA